MRLISTFRRGHVIAQGIQVMRLNRRVVLLLRLGALALYVPLVWMAGLVMVRGSVHVAGALVIVSFRALVDCHLLVVLLLVCKLLHVG